MRIYEQIAYHPLASGLAVFAIGMLCMSLAGSSSLWQQLLGSALAAAVAVAAVAPLQRNRMPAMGSRELLVGILVCAAGLASLVCFCLLPQAAYANGALGPSTVLCAVLICIATALFEETIFRGLLLDGFEKLCGSTVRAAIASAAIFGILHLSSSDGSIVPTVVDVDAVVIGQVVLKPVEAFLFGLCMTWLLGKSRCLAMPVIAHFVFDLCALAPQMGAAQSALASHVTGSPNDLVALVAATVILLAAALVGARSAR